MLEKCRGSRDLCPEDMDRFRAIEGTFRDCCLKWGYSEVRTPTLEYLHLFTSTGTLSPSMLGKVYSFLDWDGWSGERVVLRPDGTIPIARLYINNLAKDTTAKLFYVTNIFIFEPTGEQNRERWQCGVEIIGEDSCLADVELVVLALELLQKLGCHNIELRLSHAGVIKALLKRIGLNPADEMKVFDQILGGDFSILAKMKIERPDIEPVLSALFELKGKSSGFLKNVRALLDGSYPELKSSLDDFIAVTDCLEALGYSYNIDITSGRDFEYYTGIIMQLFCGRDKVAGGGRYNDLIALMGGENKPASGFALYMDKIMAISNMDQLPGQKSQLIGMRVTPGEITRALGIATQLREAGYAVTFYSGVQKPDGMRRLLKLTTGDSSLILQDRQKRQTCEATTTEELLALLGEIVN
jgi:histidyl-tRNA synthetase